MCSNIQTLKIAKLSTLVTMSVLQERQGKLFWSVTSSYLIDNMSILYLDKLQNYFSEEKGWGWKWSRGPTNLQRQMAVTTLTLSQQENFPKGFFTSWIISSFMRWNSAHIWMHPIFSDNSCSVIISSITAKILWHWKRQTGQTTHWWSRGARNHSDCPLQSYSKISWGLIFQIKI